MPTISSCPRCQKPVCIPAGLDSTALVRCPLCAAEYPLGEALPPELIPVLVATDLARAADGTVALEGAIEPQTAVEGSEEKEAEEKSTLEHEENEAAAVAMGQPRMDAMTAVHGRQRAPTSAFKRGIEVVSGGLAGLLAGYYLLALWFGPDLKTLGFPDLPLPFVAWLTTAPDKVDAAGEKPAGEKFVPTKPAGGATSPETPDAGKTPEKKAAPATPPKAGAKPSPSGASPKSP